MASRPRRSAHTPAAGGSKWIRPSTRWAIYHRDDFRCVYCLDVGPLSLDHVHSVEGRGRDNRAENLVTACFRCNSKKQALTHRQWLAKLRAMGLLTATVRRRIARAIARPIDRAVGRLLALARTDTYGDEVSEAIERPTPKLPVVDVEPDADDDSRATCARCEAPVPREGDLPCESCGYDPMRAGAEAATWMDPTT